MPRFWALSLLQSSEILTAGAPSPRISSGGLGLPTRSPHRAHDRPVPTRLGLTSGSAGDYPLTSCGGCTKVEGVDDGIEFNATVEAMKV